MNEIAPDVGILPVVFVNVYAIGTHDNWILVDCGVPKRAEFIRDNIEQVFGVGARPSAIVLTHGHFDHAGSALELAQMWDVAVYAHRLELPYLNGSSAYPPPDPTTGGPSGLLARLTPPLKTDLTPRLRDLSEWNSPLREDWQIIETPGHSPGHISLWRERDRTLVAGDAFVTVDMNHWKGALDGPQVQPTPEAFACDFGAVKHSMQVLADLKPRVLATGHGVPVMGSDVADGMQMLTDEYVPPSGRYENEAAQTNENGILSLPDKPFDALQTAAIVGGAAYVGLKLLKRRGKKRIV